MSVKDDLELQKKDKPPLRTTIDGSLDSFLNLIQELNDVMIRAAPAWTPTLKITATDGTQSKTIDLLQDIHCTDTQTILAIAKKYFSTEEDRAKISDPTSVQYRMHCLADVLWNAMTSHVRTSVRSILPDQNRLSGALLAFARGL